MSANMGGWWLYACPDCAWDLLGMLTFRVLDCTTNWPKLERTQGNFQCFSLISAVLPFRWSHLEISCSLLTHTLSRGNLLCNVCFGKNSKPSLRTFPHCCEFNCWISHDMISTHCARLHENSTVPGRHLETEHRWLAVSSSPHSPASLSPSSSTLSVSLLPDRESTAVFLLLWNCGEEETGNGFMKYRSGGQTWLSLQLVSRV